jgi:triacylglycerol lipase
VRRWRGLKALVHDAVDATTGLVAEGHDSTARTVVRFATVVFPPGPVHTADAVRKLGVEAVLGTVRAVNRGVEVVTDAGLTAAIPPAVAEEAVPLRSDALGSAPWLEDAVLGAVNGVVGDHLARRTNALDLGLSLRVEGEATGRIAVFVHGLATTEWSWSFGAARFLGDAGTNFGTLLRRDLGLSSVYARYNTGRPVADNGAALSEALGTLLAAWPVPVEELVLIGHSMGGLVCRSAGDAARRENAAWLRHLRRVVCLGTPHQGAPLERFGHAAASVLDAVDHPATRISAAVIRARSEGIQDLRYGLRDVPLLDGVAYGFFAGSVTKDPADPVSGMVGDLLVRVPSAEGPHGVCEGSFTLHTARFGGVRHHELQTHPDVYAQVRRFCAGELD